MFREVITVKVCLHPPISWLHPKYLRFRSRFWVFPGTKQTFTFKYRAICIVQINGEYIKINKHVCHSIVNDSAPWRTRRSFIIHLHKFTCISVYIKMIHLNILCRLVIKCIITSVIKLNNLLTSTMWNWHTCSFKK